MNSTFLPLAVEFIREELVLDTLRGRYFFFFSSREQSPIPSLHTNLLRLKQGTLCLFPYSSQGITRPLDSYLISEEIVLPILDSIVQKDECSLKCIKLPYKWFGGDDEKQYSFYWHGRFRSVASNLEVGSRMYRDRGQRMDIMFYKRESEEVIKKQMKELKEHATKQNGD